MKKRKISFKYRGKKISLEVSECNILEMGRGLTFRFRESAPALLFNQWRRGSMALTAVFVFFPFLVLWLDKNDNVLEVKRVKPFTYFIDSKTKYTKIVEIPINKKYRREIAAIVGERFKNIVGLSIA